MSHIIQQLFMPYVNNKGADQPEYLGSLISTFVVQSRQYNISSFYIRNFKPLTSFRGCAVWFVSYLVENPNAEDRFSCGEALDCRPDGHTLPPP